jgi:hypothetical protein
MAIDLFQTLDVIETMENFIERKRPPEDLRDKLDLSYKIEDQSIIVYEIRPCWNKPGYKLESPVAKCTLVKAKKYWKVFCFRSDLKWHSYAPVPSVGSLRDFTRLIDADEHHCFWG